MAETGISDGGFSGGGFSGPGFSGDEWRGRVGDTWADEWVRTDRSFAGLTGHLIDALAAALPSDATRAQRAVLDIGCGAGETALRLAVRRPDLAVTGLDLSDELVAAAQARSGDVPNVVFVGGDATNWRAAVPFNGALSRHGVMFFDNPHAAFAHIRAQLAPGAPFVFSCFAARADNPWASAAGDLLPSSPPADPHAPGPFAFADAGRVAGILADSGWRNAAPARIDFDYVAGAGDDPVADAVSYFARIGPVARALADLDPPARAAFRPRFAELLAGQVNDGEVRFDAAAWLWRATA